jgi:hypothetical protein
VTDKPQPPEDRDSQGSAGKETFRGMSLREGVELFLLPVTLALITVVFAWQQDERQRDLEAKLAKNAQKIENKRAEAEQDLLTQRAQDEALQAYLDQMSHLLLEKDLRNPKEGSEVRMLARADTLTLLERIGSDRRSAVLQFLVESDLVNAKTDAEPIISLADANLMGAKMFEPNLRSADLSHADLENAKLRRANLKYANLNKADWLSNKAIERQVFCLKDATMTNGQTYEDWRKDIKDKQTSKEEC